MLLLREADVSEYSVPVYTGLHKPGESHAYRIECEVCGQRGTVNLSIEPQTAAAPANFVERDDYQRGWEAGIAYRGSELLTDLSDDALWALDQSVAEEQQRRNAAVGLEP